MGSRCDKSSHDSLALWTMLCLWPEYKGNWVSRNCLEIMTFPGDGRIWGIFSKKRGAAECLVLQDKHNQAPLLQRVKNKINNLHLETKFISIACTRAEGNCLQRWTANSLPFSLRQERRASLGEKVTFRPHTHTPESLESSPWANGAGARMGGFCSILLWPSSKTRAADSVESR